MNKQTLTIRFTLYSALVASFMLLTACIPAAVGLAAVSTIDLLKERRTVGTFVDDNLVEASIYKDILLDNSLGRSVHISPTSLNGVVLLTGEVTNAEQKKRAGEIANSYQNVSQVVNQLDLVGKSSLTSRTNDTLITGKVKARLIKDDHVDASNIKVVTERGVVYLLGIVTPVEGESAISLTKKVSGVTRIVKVFMPPE